MKLTPSTFFRILNFLEHILLGFLESWFELQAFHSYITKPTVVVPFPQLGKTVF